MRADGSAHRFDQFGGVVSDSVFEDDFDWIARYRA
jgi:hypothetical protein